MALGMQQGILVDEPQAVETGQECGQCEVKQRGDEKHVVDAQVAGRS